MKRFISNQRGFALIELILIIAILGIIAFVAWRIIDASGAVDTAQNQVPKTTAGVAAETIPTAENASDLSKLESQLNAAKIDDTSGEELDLQSTF